MFHVAIELNFGACANVQFCLNMCKWSFQTGDTFNLYKK